MTSITQDDVLIILKLLDESTFDELHIETEDFKLLARKQGKGKGLEEVVFEDKKSSRAPRIEPTPAESQAPHLSSGKFTESDSRAQVAKQALDYSGATAGMIPIKAPMLGTFYRTPKPGAPPYVEVGSMVNEDDPVCIIEVMKLFNTVKAGIRGRISQICAEQGQMVEYHQTLFLVEGITEENDFPGASST
jgi:acetyl-CoA carboxylase biotin carboxyl carrier protein